MSTARGMLLVLLPNSLAGTTTSEKNHSNGHRTAESHLFLCRQLVASSCLVSQLSQYREAEYPICPLQDAMGRCTSASRAELPSSALLPQPCAHASTGTRGHGSQCREHLVTPCQLWGSLTICFCEQPLCGWAGISGRAF